jgi:hypothetical protein
MGNRLRLRLLKNLFIGLRQNRLTSSAEVEAITAVRLDRFLIMVGVSGLLSCEIPAGVDAGTAISKLTGLQFWLALPEALAWNCIP